MSQGPSMSQGQRYTQFEDSVPFDLDLKLTGVATKRVGKNKNKKHYFEPKV